MFIVIFTVIIWLSFNYRERAIQEWIRYKKKANIVMLGDSHIKNGDWNNLLNRVDVKNSGFTGFTTSHLNFLVMNYVVEYNPKYCFIEAGINDILVGIPLERTKLNYTELINILQENNIQPIIISTIPQENNLETKILVDSLNLFLQDFSKSKSLKFLNLNEKISNQKDLNIAYSPDGTHLNPEVYKIWANAILELLRTE